MVIPASIIDDAIMMGDQRVAAGRLAQAQANFEAVAGEEMKPALGYSQQEIALALKDVDIDNEEK